MLSNATRSADERHDDQDDHHDADGRGGPADRPLAPPELGLGAVARVVALGRGADPVVVVLEARHEPSLLRPEALGSAQAAPYSASTGRECYARQAQHVSPGASKQSGGARPQLRAGSLPARSVSGGRFA